MNTPSRPSAESLLAAMGMAGARICEIDASEAGAGNISVCAGWPLPVSSLFPQSETIDLPLAVPELAGHTILVTGSGRRLRQIGDDPLAAVAAITVEHGGTQGTMRTAPQRSFEKVTSEFNSHLAVHRDQVAARGVDFQAVVHAQPPHLTFLSHVPAYRDTSVMNRALMRWEPETVVAVPGGIEVLEFMVPGSQELQGANVAGLRRHEIVLWSKHGVMARSDLSVLRAVDRIEYLETAARYEYMNLCAGRVAEGLSDGELSDVGTAFVVASPWLPATSK